MSALDLCSFDPKGLRNPIKRRWSLLVLAAGLVMCLLGWGKSTGWNSIRCLRNQFSATEMERFDVGVQMALGIRILNDEVLSFHIRHDPADWARFREKAVELHEALKRNKPRVTTPNEQRLLNELEAAYACYLKGVEQIAANDDPTADQMAYGTVYELLQNQTQPLLEIIEDLIRAHHRAFDQFAKDSESALLSLERMLTFSMVLLLSLAGCLVFLVYRGMIAPLRAELDQSRNVVERHEKLASLGVLAAGVAHEIRNPLMAIKLRLYSLKEAFPQAAASDDVVMISDEIKRLDRIAQETLQFARPSEPNLARLSVNELAERVQQLVRGHLEMLRITLTLEGAAEIWLRADAQQIEQVLLNLIQNSAQSIGRDGCITVTVEERLVPLSGRFQRAVILAVTDTGAGVRPELEKRLFAPFFTTKANGTGLGLAIAARIVEKHGGALSYRPKIRGANRGGAFEIILPKWEDDGT
jgi:signal transduction histidine kinase